LSRKFSTIVVSLCRSEPFEINGGNVLNNEEVINFLKSRFYTSVEEFREEHPKGKKEPTCGKLIIISKESALNDTWRKAFYSAKGVEVLST
jgi:hypothetical protein